MQNAVGKRSQYTCPSKSWDSFCKILTSKWSTGSSAAKIVQLDGVSKEDSGGGGVFCLANHPRTCLCPTGTAITQVVPLMRESHCPPSQLCCTILTIITAVCFFSANWIILSWLVCCFLCDLVKETKKWAPQGMPSFITQESRSIQCRLDNLLPRFYSENRRVEFACVPIVYPLCRLVGVID